MNVFARRRDLAAAHGRGPRFPWPSWGDVGAWLVALAIAIGLWLFVNTGERMSERTLRIRLEPVNLPAGLVVTNPVAEHAEVRVSGPGIILSGIDPRRARTDLDLSGVRPGLATYALNPKMFPLPRKVEVIRITPAQVSFQVDRLIRRTVPVRLDREGEVAAGYVVAEIDVEPDKVEVAGPSAKLEGLRGVSTEPFDFASLGPGEVSSRLRLAGLGDLVQLAPAEVVIRVRVEEAPEERTIGQLAVEVRGAGGAWRTVPAEVTAVVRGPAAAVRSLELGRGSVYVDASGLAALGSHRVRPSVELPEGVALVRLEPAAVTLEAAARHRAPVARKAETRRE